MDRGARLFSFLNKASQLLHAPRSQSDARELLCDLVEENLEFFRSFAEYVQHVASLQLAKDFAHLPNEVINDVVAFAAEAQDDYTYVQADLRFLLNLDGSWGHLAQQQNLIKLKGQRLFSKSYRLGQVQKDFVSLQDVGSRRIGYAKITPAEISDFSADSDLLSTVAARLHQNVTFKCVTNAPSNVLRLFAGPFTKIVWHCAKNEVKNRLQRGPIDFIKRHLQSKHLMELNIAAEGFEDGELDQLLVNFVKRPFRNLYFAKSPSDGSSHSAGASWYENVGGYCLPFELVEEACKTWEATNEFLIDKQNISGAISKETFARIEERFQLESDNLHIGRLGSVERKHPRNSSALMKLHACKNYDRTEVNTVQLRFRYRSYRSVAVLGARGCRGGRARGRGRGR